jgi:hypothetical protein
MDLTRLPVDRRTKPLLRFLLSPTVAIAALVLLLIDCVFIGGAYGSNLGPMTDMGRFFGRFVGADWANMCGRTRAYYMERNTDGSMLLSLRSEHPPSAAVNDPNNYRKYCASATYDTRSKDEGFWAPTCHNESQEFHSYEPLTLNPLSSADDQLARQALANWFTSRGCAPGRFDPTLGDYDRTTILWSGVFHTAGAAACALLSLSLPFTVGGRIRAWYARRQLETDFCSKCKYHLIGLAQSPNGIRRCPECGYRSTPAATGRDAAAA